MNQKLRIIVDRSLLGHFNTLRKVFRADVDDLLKVDGIGKVRAERLKRLLDLKYNGNV